MAQAPRASLAAGPQTRAALLKAVTGTDTLLLSAPEYHCPGTVLTLEAPFERVPDEGAGEALKSNCRAKRTILGHGSADLLRPTLKIDLTNSDLVAHSDC